MNIGKVLLRAMAVAAGLAASLSVSFADELAWQVKLPTEPKPWEVTAAAELADFLSQRVGGNSLTVGGVENPIFHVGDTDFARSKQLTSDRIENERWLVKAFGRDVIVNGGGSHGALYAVSHFLEDRLGIRFWSETEIDVPRCGSVKLAALDLTGKPRFFYRDIYRSESGSRTSSRHAIRRRLNRNGCVKVPASFGGAFVYGPPDHAHTFDMYIPWSKYGKDHPEWFSLVKGKRWGGGGYETGGQLCFANCGFRQVFLDQILKNIADSRAKAAAEGLQPPQFFEISMNDNHKYCECEGCKKLAEQYGKSGVYLNFVNDIAGEVAKRYPDVFITMLAYFFTEETPKAGIKPADNVIVKLCNTRSNMLVSINHDDNHIMRELVTGWEPIAKHVFIWDYDITYTEASAGFPFPSELYYADKYRFFDQHKVEGIFWEHEVPDKSDLYDLKYYLKTKLFEDPYVDYPKLLEQTFNEFFGAKAGPRMLAVRRRLDEARKRNNGRVEWFPNVSSFNYIKGEDLDFILGEYGAAEKDVGDNWILKNRITRARLGFDMLNKVRAPLMNRQGPDAKRPARLPPPKGFEGRSFWDFYADNFTLYTKGTGVELVNEPSSPVGKAAKVPIDNEKYKLPFLSAFYDQKTKKTSGGHNLPKEKIEFGKWKWYSGGKMETTDDGFIYLTTQWTVQITLPPANFGGKKFKFAYHARFSEKEVLIDRVVLIDSAE